MFGNIVIGYDGSERARDALALARLLAGSSGAKLTVAAGDPSARELHRLADELEAGLIVVGASRRSGLERIVGGDVVGGLLQGAPCTVAVAPTGYREQARVPRVVGAALDGSAESRGALGLATGLAEHHDASLRLLTVVSPIAASHGWGYGYAEFEQGQRERLQVALHEALGRLPGRLRAEGRLLHGDAASALARASGQGLDALCIGSRGHGPLLRVLLGSVSAQLVETVACPLFVTPRPAPDAAAQAASVSGGRAVAAGLEKTSAGSSSGA